MAVCHCHDLRSLTTFRFADLRSPFLAGAKLPSMKASRTSSRPRICRSSATASRTPRMIPDRTHCWNRRWHVWYEGYRSGKSAQGAPVRSTHRMPLRTLRRPLQGAAAPVLPARWFGDEASRTAHWRSVSSRALSGSIGFTSENYYASVQNQTRVLGTSITTNQATFRVSVQIPKSPVGSRSGRGRRGFRCLG
jgi:hypothetical protein